MFALTTKLIFSRLFLPIDIFFSTFLARVTAGCRCGVKRENRIVGGEETEVNEYPWMAALTTPSGVQVLFSQFQMRQIKI